MTEALRSAKTSGDLALETIPDVTLEMPKNRAHGDWATGVALGLARTLGMPPREVAAKIVSHLPVGGDSLIARAEIAGPGFINLTLRPDWLGDILRRIEPEGDGIRPVGQRGRAERHCRVRLHQPERPDHRGGGPQRRHRRHALLSADCDWASKSRASITSMMP